MTDVSDEELAELARLHSEATQGEWTATFDEATKIKDQRGDSLLIMMQTNVRGLRPMDEVNRTARSIVANHNAIGRLITELQARRAAEAKAVEALREIAQQELSADMSVDDQLGGDFEGAYDHMIEIARAALGARDD